MTEKTEKPMLVDQPGRDRIAKDLDATLVVEAAAGTGKTTALVDRILALLRTGKATLASGAGDLVAVTFTEKAAGEMKLRLRTEIEKARRDESVPVAEKERLDHALEQLEAARIGTIHAFCADILRERPVEAKVDPLFEVAAEDETDRIFDEAFTRWFQQTLQKPSKDVPGVSRVLRRATRGAPGGGPGISRDQDGPRTALRRAGRNLLEQRDFPTPYSKHDGFDRAGELDRIASRLRGLAEWAPKGFADSWLTKSLREIERVVFELDRRGDRDHDFMEAQLRQLARARCWNWKGGGTWFSKADNLTRAQVLEARDDVKADLERVLDMADAELAALLFGELQGVVKAYEDLKASSGKLDFLDLMLVTRTLLQTNDDVRAELQKRFGRLLVDEFQDTDPLQADILLLLCSDDATVTNPDLVKVVPGKLFLVGDPKQSIYRFRRADVSLYERIKRRLEADGAGRVNLQTSFRSAPSIQGLVNAAFEPLMKTNEKRTQAEYVPLAAHRPDPTGRPSVVALPVPKPYSDYGKVVQWKIEESLPEMVGAFVEWLVNQSGWKVTERGSDTPVPIESKHVCLLFKRLQSFGNDVTRPYVRALESRRIAHVLVGGKSFHEREEVIALRSALTAIEWPDDTLSVYATLHGPFFALTDDALLAFKHAQKHLHPLRKRDESKLTELTRPVAAALDELGRLHVGRNRHAVADTIARFLETTRAHAGVAIWPAGEQALGNILRVLDMARRFEQGNATSFRAFVGRLEEDAARGGVNEAPVVEEGTDGVRVMTVHKAKGLEFPVVVLVDPTATATFREPSRYVDATAKLWAVPLCGATPKELLDRREEILQQDLEEAHRLLYVATTRARELLVVPVVGDEREDGSGEKSWLAPLDEVLYPYPEERRDAQAGPGCPPFGDDSVLERPMEANRGPSGSVKPGLHRGRAGTHEVVWWDPRALVLDKDDEAGLRQQKILAADDKGVVAKEGIEQHDTWRAARAKATADAALPSLIVRTVTDAKDAPPAPGENLDVAIETSAATKKARPHGKRFGILVHAMLATVALDADASAIADAGRIQGRIAGANDEEIDAARDVVAAALAHPLLSRARSAERVERETALMHRSEDGSIVEGVVDLAFFEKGTGWTVVDFKTDIELASRKDAYVRQIDAYARAIAAATGDPAKGALLSV